MAKSDTLTIDTENPKKSYTLKGINKIILTNSTNDWGTGNLADMITDISFSGKNTILTMANQKKLTFSNVTDLSQVVVEYMNGDTLKRNAAGTLRNVLNAKLALMPITEPMKGNKITGSFLKDIIDLSEYRLKDKNGNDILDNSKKGLTIDGYNGSDTITGSIYKDTIKGGEHDDVIKGSLGNDVITGGTGSNTVKYTSLDQLDGDKINLTKGEKLTIDVSGIEGATAEYKINGKDLDVIVTKDDVSKTLKLVGYGAKDVTNNATKKTADTSYVRVKTSAAIENFKDNLFLATEKGTWHNNIIDKSGYVLYKDKAKTIVEDDYTKKGLTIDGGAGNDRLIGTNYSDTIKAGTGVDSITGGLGNDKLNGGTTADSKTTFLFYNGDGDDVITSGKGTETVLFYGNRFDKLTYTQNGKDLVVGYNMDPEGKTQDSVTIKNHFDKKGNAVSNVKYLRCYEGTFELETLRKAYNEDNILINEGTNGNDNILITGYEAVDIGEGDDTINMGDTYVAHITMGHGKKTLITPEGSGSSQIRITTAENLTREYYKVGDDLVIKYTDEGWENDSFTVKGYYDGKRNVFPYYNDSSVYTELVNKGLIVYGEGLIEGTKDTDRIFGSDKADTIYLNRSDKVYPGKGDDTLIWQYEGSYNGYPSTMGQQEVYLKNGDGNDTFIFEGRPTSFYQLHFDTGTTLKYERKNNDLVIHSMYGDNQHDSVTIKDWKVSDLSGGRILVYQGEEIGNQDKYTAAIRDDEKNGILQVFSVNTSLNLNLYGSDDNDALSMRGTNINAYGYAGDDLYYVRGTGLSINDSAGNETYRGYALQNKATINDLAGNDTLTLFDETYGNLNDNMENRQVQLLFNVANNYKAADGVAAVGDIIVTADSSKANYDLWQNDGDFKGISIKNNAVENINTLDGYSVTNADIATLAENVATWLSDNGYADVNAVFAENDADNITALIAQFNTANWQEPAVG